MKTNRRLRWLFLAVVAGLMWPGCPVNAEETSAESDVLGDEAYQMLMRFYDYDKTIPLEARVVEKKETDDAIREKIVVRGVRGRLVPGVLEMPKEGAQTYPCVFLAHGWSGSKDSWWEDDNYISGGNVRKALLRAGYAVFAMDAPTHGGRIAENDYGMVNVYSGPGSGERKNYFTTEEIVTQAVADYRRGLDYLETRPELDMKRLGILGYSMGGWHTFAITAADPRIRVAVACVTPGRADKFDPLAVKNYAPRLGDRPFLMLMGRTDSMCTEEHAQMLLELLSSNEKNLIFYESGHRLPKEYVPDALAWIEEYL